MFFRLETPRPRAQQSFPPGRRGASPPASPCFFVLRHHVPEHSSRSRQAVVVPHCPLALVSSSWGTTSSGTAAVPAGRAWCPPPTSSCFFVLGHHVPERRRKVMHQDFRLRASLFPYYIFKGKELTTNTTRPPFVVNSNHLPVPLAPTCIRHHKKLTTDSRIRKVCRQSNYLSIFLL